MVVVVLFGWSEGKQIVSLKRYPASRGFSNPQKELCGLAVILDQNKYMLLATDSLFLECCSFVRIPCQDRVALVFHRV